MPQRWKGVNAAGAIASSVVMSSAIAGIVFVEKCALDRGLDGILLTTSVAALTAIAGYQVQNIKKVLSAPLGVLKRQKAKKQLGRTKRKPPA